MTKQTIANDDGPWRAHLYKTMAALTALGAVVLIGLWFLVRSH